jgi:hypothetical protein
MANYQRSDGDYSPIPDGASGQLVPRTLRPAPGGYKPRDPEHVAAETERLIGSARARVLGAAPQAPRAVAPVVAAPADQAAVLAAMQKAYDLQYLTLVAQTDAVTGVEGPFFCDEIGSDAGYLPLVKNRTDNLIRVQVTAELTIPGAGVKLAYSPDPSDSTKIDVLALTANGRVLSVPIILAGGQTLWVASHDTNFALTAAEKLFSRIFDAAQMIAKAGINVPRNLR